MVTHDRLSLRDAADALELERVRLFRLGHYLHLAPGDPCLSPEVILRAYAEPEAEQRYHVVLDWLLDHL
jgi:hypothetical protein